MENFRYFAESNLKWIRVVGCMKIPYTLVQPTKSSIDIRVMATYCNSICNCLKSKQRKDSLRLTL
jgi:hypothetical protein